MELKYVRHSIVGFVLWPRTNDLWHSQIGSALPHLGRIESAGFADVAGGEVVCWGESESLKIKSKPEDSEALAKQLGLQSWETAQRLIEGFGSPQTSAKPHRR